MCHDKILLIRPVVKADVYVLLEHLAPQTMNAKSVS